MTKNGPVERKWTRLECYPKEPFLALMITTFSLSLEELTSNKWCTQSSDQTVSSVANSWRTQLTKSDEYGLHYTGRRSLESIEEKSSHELQKSHCRIFKENKSRKSQNIRTQAFLPTQKSLSPFKKKTSKKVAEESEHKFFYGCQVNCGQFWFLRITLNLDELTYQGTSSTDHSP